MATSKHARYRFRVKETAGDPVVAVEPSGTEPESEYPVDSLWFCLRPGISIEEAQQVADFMNAELLMIGAAQRGDVEDITREARHGGREKWAVFEVGGVHPTA
jgi:hypothetical protein